jgi:hypothetical protein
MFNTFTHSSKCWVASEKLQIFGFVVSREEIRHIMPAHRKLNPAVMFRLHAAIHGAQSEYVSMSDIKACGPKKRRDHPIPSSSILCALCKEWIIGPTHPVGSDRDPVAIRAHWTRTRPYVRHLRDRRGSGLTLTLLPAHRTRPIPWFESGYEGTVLFWHRHGWQSDL